MKPQVVGIIPARYASTRLPGKALRMIRGKPMIQRVYGAAVIRKLSTRSMWPPTTHESPT